MTQGRSSPQILYMLGTISSSPCNFQKYSQFEGRCGVILRVEFVIETLFIIYTYIYIYIYTYTYIYIYIYIHTYIYIYAMCSSVLICNVLLWGVQLHTVPVAESDLPSKTRRTMSTRRYIFIPIYICIYIYIYIYIYRYIYVNIHVYI